MAEFFFKKEQFKPWQIHSAVWNKKADDPTRRTKCIFTALQGDAHLYSRLPKPQDFGRAHIFRAHTPYTGREKQGEKKVKAWVREINEELIYRECRNPPQQSREKQGRIAAPWRAQAATSPRTDTAVTREWGEQGGSSTGTAEELDRSFTPGTGWAHQTDTLHDRNTEQTAQSWGCSHLTTASQVTPATAHRASFHHTMFLSVLLLTSQRNTQLWLNWAPSNADMLPIHLNKTVQVSLGREMAHIISHTFWKAFMFFQKFL